MIGGFTVPEKASLKKLVTTVLKAVHPRLDNHDVVEAQVLKNKADFNATRTSNKESKGATKKSSANQDETLNAPSSFSTAPDTETTTSATANSSSVRTFPSSIVVSVSSRPLLLSILRNKVSMGKLHTASLLTTLQSENEPTTLTLSLINIKSFYHRKSSNFNATFTKLQSNLIPNSNLTFTMGKSTSGGRGVML